MVIGTVTGILEAKRTAPEYEEIRWIQVKSGSELTVAMNPVDAKTGDLVLIVEGAAAERYSMSGCADAVAVAVLAKDGNNS